MTINDVIRQHGEKAATSLIESLIGAMKHDAHNALPSDDYPDEDTDAETAMAFWEGELCAVLRAHVENACYDAPPPEPVAECASCSEGLPPSDCPNSERGCGHHCNHSWDQDACCWCGEEFGEMPTPAPSS